MIETKAQNGQRINCCCWFRPCWKRVHDLDVSWNGPMERWKVESMETQYSSLGDSIFLFKNTHTIQFLMAACESFYNIHFLIFLFLHLFLLCHIILQSSNTFIFALISLLETGFLENLCGSVGTVFVYQARGHKFESRLKWKFYHY